MKMLKLSGLGIFLAVVVFSVPLASWADEFRVSGEIIDADRSLSIIVIAPDEGGNDVTIIGFPFNNLEKQLDAELDPDEGGITIEEGDCVTVVYYDKELASGDVVYKWVSLIDYCEECQTELCYEDEDGMTRAPGRNKHRRPPPWAGGSGKP